MTAAYNSVAELQALRDQLAEAQATLDAIRSGGVDAIVDTGGKLFHRNGAEQPYVTFFDVMNEGGVTLDASGAILHANERFASMLGRTLGELRGTPFIANIAAADRPTVGPMLQSGGRGVCDASIQGNSGELCVQLSWITINTGDVSYCCVVITDITERIKAEAELRIAAIAFESQESTIVTDARSVIVRANNAFSRLTGYSAAEAIGHRPSILRSGRHDPEFYMHMWAALLSHKFWQGEIWNRHKDGSVYPHWLTISAVSSPDGEITHFVGVLSEITKNKEAEAEIHRLAYYDPLTGLPNRRLLMDRLQQAVASTARSGNYSAVLFLDLDNFKTLNDTRGHDAGDILLREVALRLRQTVREIDTVSRLGGDEFLIILEDLGRTAADASFLAQSIAEKVRSAVGHPYEITGRKSNISASIGVSLFWDHEVTVEDLLRHADLALYKAKDSGRNAISFYDPVMQALLQKNAALETDLRQAIENQQMYLAFQPQVDASRSVVSAEVLLRWQHPTRGNVTPKDFIPIAEKSGQIVSIGHWVLSEACNILAKWALQPNLRHLTLAVNVSQHQFRQAGFVSEVKEVLELSGANPYQLKVELTESMLIEDIGGAMEKMRELNAIGVNISIDDFGTGYSSLSYLMRLPIEQLKIDQSFVINLPSEARDAIVTRTIIDMAHNLSLNVIAEGVETEAQFEFLLKHGCPSFQGFLISPALPLAEFEAFIDGAN